ncbi:MAG: hypothetical protein IKS30_04350 [Treponema sp.]|nr:hypothetical protein [Treponema sp.]
MKNRISVLFSVILGALLITSCSNVFQPNKKVADIEVKASLSGTMARGPVSRETAPYSFIDGMLKSSDNQSYTYYEIISTLMSEYGLSEDAAYDVLADKMLNLNFSNYANYWMQIKTNFGQKSEKVYPYVDLIKSYYKAAIKPAYIYYSFLDEAELLSDGQLDSQALLVYFGSHQGAEVEFTNLSNELAASTKALLDEPNFDFTTVSLKLNSVPFDQEVKFTLLISFNEKEEPIEYTFTKFVNPGLNVFDFTPSEATATGDDVIDDDNGGSGGDDEGDTNPVVEPDQDSVVDPWEGYTTYYVSNSPAEGATDSEDAPMSLIDAFSKCTKNYDETKTKYAIILTEDITISETLTVPESAYIVITGNYDGSIKTIQAGERLEKHMFSIDNYANLGLSSLNLKGNTYCQLFYCSNSVSEEGTVTESEGDTETDQDLPTGTLTMENCTVTDFLGTQKIGIITMATGGKMTITGCTFNNNIVGAAGAVNLNNGTLNLNIEGLLDSSLSSLSTNSFSDTTGDNSPCEIYLKGTGIFNEKNIFTNTAIYAVHVAGWATLTLYNTYYSGSGKLKIYSTTDGSFSDEDPGINTIKVDAEDTVIIDDGGDRSGEPNEKTPTYILTVIN